MDARTRLMLILSLLGIIFLLFLAQILKPQIIPISKLNTKNPSFFQSNQEIKLIANITSIRQIANSTTIFTLKGSNAIITGIIFEANPKILNLNKSKTYEITGKLSEYKNETEIIISKINLLTT